MLQSFAKILVCSFCGLLTPWALSAVNVLPSEKAQLDQGVFPERLKEELRIVEFDATTEYQVQEYLLGLQRSKIPRLNHKKITYLIADLKDENAFAFTGENLNWVVFSRPLLKKFRFEDELMWALSHELYHVLIDAKGRNTKAEEGLADHFAFRQAHESGYDLRTIDAFIREFFKEYFKRHGKAGSKQDFSILMDPHLKPENRIDVLQKMMGSFELAEGGLQTSPRPIDAGFTAAITSHMHIGFMAQRPELPNALPIDRLIDGLRYIKPYYGQRTNDFVNELRGFAHPKYIYMLAAKIQI
jgi:hypothetical protein